MFFFIAFILIRIDFLVFYHFICYCFKVYDFFYNNLKFIYYTMGTIIIKLFDNLIWLLIRQLISI